MKASKQNKHIHKTDNSLMVAGLIEGVFLLALTLACVVCQYHDTSDEPAQITRETETIEEVKHTAAEEHVAVTTDDVVEKLEEIVVAVSSTSPEVEEIESEKTEAIPIYTDKDVELIAKTLWGECRGIEDDVHKAAVVWCILNRVDAEGYGFGHGIEYVITFPEQFHGYRDDNPVTDELIAIAEDVLQRWQREKDGEIDVGRVLPKEYLWFCGDGKHNHFRDSYRGGNVWDWSLENPYTENSDNSLTK